MMHSQKYPYNRLALSPLAFLAVIALGLHLAGTEPAAQDDSTIIQPHVGRFVVSGNKSFSDGTLKNLGLLSTPRMFSHKKLVYKPVFSFSRVRRDTTLIRRFYESNGFMNISMKADTVVRKQHAVKISIHLNEGVRTTVKSIHLLGMPSDIKHDFMRDLSVQSNNPLKISALNRDVQYCTGKLAEAGYLEGSAQYTLQFSQDSSEAAVYYTVTPGPHIRVANIRILGLRSVRQPVVKRVVRFKNERILTSKDLRTTINNLYATNLFNFVMISYDSLASNDPLNDSARIIRVNLIETKFFTAEVSGGFQTKELLRGRVNVSYDNFFGRGIQGNSSLYANYLLQGVDLGSTWPWIFRLPITLNQTVSWYHQAEGIPPPGKILPIIDWEGNFTELRNTFTYQLTRTSSASLVHSLQTKKILFISDKIDSNLIGKPFTHSIGLSFIRDVRNNVFDPQKGAYSNIAASISGITGGARGNHFIRLEGDQRWYYSLGESTVLASALRGGIQRAYGPSENVPIEQVFRIDGLSVMRGFYPRQLGPGPSGGTLYLTWNVAELRFPIYKWLRGDLFLDAGNLWNIQSKSMSEYARVVSKWDFRYNAGTGLRIHLPVFILSIDVGFKLDKLKNESLYAIQFNLGNSF